MDEPVLTAGSRSTAAPGAARTTPPTLAVAGLRKSFGGVPAVDGVDLLVHAGEVVGLIGPNGSGKSTTINVISGALRPDGGTVSLAGRDITGRPAHLVAQAGLARSFQIPRVWGRMSVAENLLVAGTPLSEEAAWRSLLLRRRARATRRRVEERVVEVLDRVLLSRLADHRAETLSGGQKRLLEFGRIMMSGATVLLLDEPFAGVNPVLRESLQQVIEGLRLGGCAVLLVEHNLSAVEQTCSRVVVMATGKVIAAGPLAEVRTLEQVVSAYLGGAA